METKRCRRCMQEFPLSKEYFYSNGYTPLGKQKWKPTCKPCENAERKASSEDLILSVYPNLSCTVCGYSRCSKAIEFHHIDPRTKLFNISQVTKNRVNKEVFLAELAKCIPLCANCHREFHAGMLELPILMQ